MYLMCKHSHYLASDTTDINSMIALNTGVVIEVALPMSLRIDFSLFGKAPALIGVEYSVHVKYLLDTVPIKSG
jgi:hypothetical protein